ncbi:MAG: GNAT family N-acetyltransferase [Bacteroidota bacterium]
MFSFHTFDSYQKIGSVEKIELINFLYDNLDEFRDKKEDIEKAIDFAIRENGNLPEKYSFGGVLIICKDNNDIAGAVVINRTGMKGYIPENILVYISVHREYRGKGLGKKLMEKAIEMVEGDIALHVEYDNPARFLYEKIGFTSKYMEMRYRK